MERERFSGWRTGLAFLVPFLLYLFTLAPTIYALDSAELTTAAATGGLVRATGYPLYLLLGRAWSLLPLGDVGYRMNLFSAFNGALTVALAERILRRLDVDPWAALGALGLLATAPFFWALSIVAEVYTLHTALMAVVILALLRWADKPSPGRLTGVTFLLGASAGNHAATLLLVPGVAWYLLRVAPRRVLTARALLLGSTGLLAGLSFYLYLPLRYGGQPAFNYAGTYDASGRFVPADLHSLEGFSWLVLGRAFMGRMFAYRGREIWRELGRFGVQLWRAFFATGIGPGLVGAVRSGKRAVGGMLLLMFVCNAGFYIDYRVADKEMMFLPTFLIWALWVGVGYQTLLEWVRRDRDPLLRRWGIRLVQGTAVSAVALATIWNWPLVNLSDDWSARAHGQEVLDAVEPDALVLAWWDTAPVVEYLQLMEGQRHDVEVINRFLIAEDDMLTLIQSELHHRPVYVDKTSPSLLRVASVEAEGPLYRLWPPE